MATERRLGNHSRAGLKPGTSGSLRYSEVCRVQLGRCALTATSQVLVCHCLLPLLSIPLLFVLIPNTPMTEPLEHDIEHDRAAAAAASDAAAAAAADAPSSGPADGDGRPHAA
jgi:predicted cobalt transporter CbtA